MAIRYAVATGNWSSTSTWDGGTLPASGDDVYANGFTVSINQSITVKSLKKVANASPVIATGGAFNVTASATITITDGITAGDNGANSTALLNINTGTPTVTINANIAGGAVSTSSRRGVTISVAATVTINGNVTGGNAGGNHAVLVSGAADVTINGTATGGNGGANGVNGGSTSKITVHGVIVGGVSTTDVGVSFSGVLRVDAEMRYSAAGVAPIMGGSNPPMFMRGGSNLAVTAPSDDNWPVATGADISLVEGGGGRYTLAVGDSAVTGG